MRCCSEAVGSLYQPYLNCMSVFDVAWMSMNLGSGWYFGLFCSVHRRKFIEHFFLYICLNYLVFKGKSIKEITWSEIQLSKPLTFKMFSVCLPVTQVHRLQLRITFNSNSWDALPSMSCSANKSQCWLFIFKISVGRCWKDSTFLFSPCGRQRIFGLLVNKHIPAESIRPWGNSTAHTIMEGWLLLTTNSTLHTR